MESNEPGSLRYDETSRPRRAFLRTSDGIVTLTFDDECRVRSLVDPATSGSVSYLYDKGFRAGLSVDIQKAVDVCGRIVTATYDTRPPKTPPGLEAWTKAFETTERAEELLKAIEAAVARRFGRGSLGEDRMGELCNRVALLLLRAAGSNEEVRRRLVESPVRIDDWLKKVLDNLALEAARSQRRSEKHGAAEDDAKAIAEFPTHDPPADKRIDRDDALAKLPERQAEVLKQRSDGHSYEEIAQKLGISVDQVRYAWKKGTETLGQIFRVKD